MDLQTALGKINLARPAIPGKVAPFNVDVSRPARKAHTGRSTPSKQIFKDPKPPSLKGGSALVRAPGPKNNQKRKFKKWRLISSRLDRSHMYGLHGLAMFQRARTRAFLFHLESHFCTASEGAPARGDARKVAGPSRAPMRNSCATLHESRALRRGKAAGKIIHCAPYGVIVTITPRTPPRDAVHI